MEIMKNFAFLFYIFILCSISCNFTVFSVSEFLSSSLSTVITGALKIWISKMNIRLTIYAPEKKVVNKEHL